MKTTFYRAVPFIFLATSLLACGGGVPIEIHIDEFQMALSLDDIMDEAFNDLKGQGIFAGTTSALPVLWPKSMSDLRYSIPFASPPVSIDLDPEEGTEEAEKYQAINNLKDAINKIEFNRLVLRIEENSLTMALPELRFQVADQLDARVDDRLAWHTIGSIPQTEPGFVGDLELLFVPSGESFLNVQLSDDEKKFSIRVTGRLDIDTSITPRLPSGKVTVRLIAITTFYLEPRKAL